jgi:hypothetical protein
MVLPLAEGALYALINPVVLDGRLSWYPPHVRGVAPVSCYLLTEPDEALLVDTGLTAHRASLLSDLEAVLAPETPLSILHTRLGEYGSICNTLAVLERFAVRAVYGTFPAHEWVGFEPEADDGGPSREELWAGVACPLLAATQTIELGSRGRRVDVFASPLRLLPAHWLHDARTGTLFTSDSFTAAVRPDPAGPWTVTEDDDPSTLAGLHVHLRAERYWWLDEADATPIRRRLQEHLDGRAISRICPGYGCIVDGPGAVGRHRARMDQVLARAGSG